MGGSRVDRSAAMEARAGRLETAAGLRPLGVELLASTDSAATSGKALLPFGIEAIPNGRATKPGHKPF